MMLGSFGAPLEAMRTPVDAPEIRPARKRKAEAQDSNNERLSKRLGLLNLGNVAASVCPVLFCAALACGAADGMPPMAEQSGTKLYVPVEAPQPPAPPPTPSTSLPPSPDADADVSRQPRRRPRAPPEDDDSMQLDDSKHKVYINNLDDELSSESEAEDGKLVFLPDIEKHLRATRIPPAVLPNRDGELAGMQLVLYSDPASLSVPREHDSVRKAILEARARMRERLRDEREARPHGAAGSATLTPAPLRFAAAPPLMDGPGAGSLWTESSQVDADDDAMDLD